MLRKEPQMMDFTGVKKLDNEYHLDFLSEIKSSKEYFEVFNSIFSFARNGDSTMDCYTLNLKRPDAFSIEVAYNFGGRHPDGIQLGLWKSQFPDSRQVK